MICKCMCRPASSCRLHTVNMRPVHHLQEPVVVIGYGVDDSTARLSLVPLSVLLSQQEMVSSVAHSVDNVKAASFRLQLPFEGGGPPSRATQVTSAFISTSQIG